MVLGFGPTSTPPQRGGNETPAIPSGKIIIIAAAIVLLAAAMFAIFGGGGADVLSSSGSGSADVPAGSDSGSGGSVAPDDSDSDSSAEFTPTAELTLSNGVVVSVRGLKIVELSKGQSIPHVDMVTGTMYVYPGRLYNGPAASVEIATKKRNLDDISFSSGGVFVSNIRTEDSNDGRHMAIFADMQIPELKILESHIIGLSSRNEELFDTYDLDLTSDSINKGFNVLGASITKESWKDTKMVIIDLSVSNK